MPIISDKKAIEIRGNIRGLFIMFLIKDLFCCEGLEKIEPRHSRVE